MRINVYSQELTDEVNVLESMAIRLTPNNARD